MRNVFFIKEKLDLNWMIVKGGGVTMHTIVSIIFGAILILIGIIFSLRRIYIIRREYITIFIMFIPALSPILNNRLSFFWIVFLPMALLATTIHKGRFTLVNVTNPMVMETVTAILEEKDIAHLIEDEQVVLGGQERLIISFQQSMNSVELNLREIGKLPIYKELLEELKIRLREKKSVGFPSTGVFLIVGGGLLSTMMVLLF